MSRRPFRKELQLWRDFPGGFYPNGNPITKPDELVDAETILGLCRTFHCLPSQLENEGAELLKLMKIEDFGRRVEVDE